jgi:hypothetical protein
VSPREREARAAHEAADRAWYAAWRRECEADPSAPARGRLPATQASYDAAHAALVELHAARGYTMIDVTPTRRPDGGYDTWGT